MTDADFREAYERNKDLLFRFARRMTGSNETAEDIVQECFLRLWRDSTAYDPARGSLRSFLLGVTRNLTLKRISRERIFDEPDESVAVCGPIDPVSRERGEVISKAVGALPPLQTLLAQRFQLHVHRESREIPMSSLTLGKNGPKFKESTADETPQYGITGHGAEMHMVVAKGTMAQLASGLSGNGAGRPVMDKTGLTGVDSFRLDWVNDTAAVSELPSLAVALQEQLGLKLEPAKGPAEFIVVDNVDRPSAN